MFKKEIVKINYSELPHMLSKSIFKLQHLEPFQSSHGKTRKYTTRRGGGSHGHCHGSQVNLQQTTPAQASRESRPGGLGVSRRRLWLPLTFANPEGWEEDLKCRSSFQSRIFCQHYRQDRVRISYSVYYSDK